MQWSPIRRPIAISRDALSGSRIEAAAGEEALIEAAQRPADWVMAAISGSVGLKPTMAAIERGATVALANKECLVCAGSLFMRRAASAGATVLPVDSEHNAVFQALGVRHIAPTSDAQSSRHRAVRSEPGRRRPSRRQRRSRRLRHPNWSMGPKVTIDSATLMNKGLELIEAHHLFCAQAGRNRCARASAIGCARAWSNSATARLSRNSARPTCAFRSPIVLPGRGASMGRRRGSTLPRCAN